MPRNNIESQPNSEPEENKKVIRIGEKEFKRGDFVNYDNGDGIEKDWTLMSFDGKEVKIFKLIGVTEEHSTLKALPLNNRYIEKIVPIDEFISENQ